MRLGTKIAIVGILMVGIGLSQPAVFEKETFDCGTSIFDRCGWKTTVEPNYLRTVLLAFGGFLFVGGFGGWIGTLDAEGRQQ